MCFCAKGTPHTMLMRLLGPGIKASWLQRSIWWSFPDTRVYRIVAWELDGRTAEHNQRWLRRLINDFLSTWWEVCGRVTWGALPGPVLFVTFYQLLRLKVCLSHFQLLQSGGGSANSIDDRTKTQWDHQAVTVDWTLENGTLGRKGSLHFWGLRINSISLPWETWGLVGKQGQEVWLFSAFSKAHMDLWKDEGI